MLNIFKYVTLNFMKIEAFKISSYMVYIANYFTIVYFSEGKYGTPLACAASKGHVKIVNYLLGQNVDVNGGVKVIL